jgi:hypothetical protein
LVDDTNTDDDADVDGLTWLPVVAGESIYGGITRPDQLKSKCLESRRSLHAVGNYSERKTKKIRRETYSTNRSREIGQEGEVELSVVDTRMHSSAAAAGADGHDSDG